MLKKTNKTLFQSPSRHKIIFFIIRCMSSKTFKHNKPSGKRTQKNSQGSKDSKDSKTIANYITSVKQGANISKYFDINFKIWVFIPVYNFAKFLNRCFKSLENQTYTNFNLLIIDDGSNDDSSKTIADWAKKFNSVHVITNKANKGPGYTKWQAIQYISKKAFKHDIFTILDGDDAYSSNKALETIVNAYLITNCWMTHGSADGIFSKRTFKLNQEDIDNIRKDEGFNFQHPRSCLCFLLDYMKEADFQDSEKQWLMRVTDRMFVFKLLELSGEKNVCNIKDSIYFYREHDDNVRNKVPKDYKKDIIKYISTTKPAERIKERINIVMCCYKRHDNLKEIIQAVDNQSVSNIITLHIINTNPEKDKWVFLQNLAKSHINKNIELKICNANKNLYGYARFLYVKHLLQTEFLSYVMFIDDDQKLAKEWVEKMYETRKPLAYNCWFGRVFKMYPDTKKVSYWDSILSASTEFKNIKYDTMKEFHYGGTCGCVIDANIFRFNVLFQCPNEYRNIEDLWLSYIVKQVVGGKINLIREPIKMHQFDNEGETALWKTIGERKSVFLRLLIDCGYIKTKGFNKNKLEGIVEEKNDSQKLIDNFTF